MDAMPAVGVVVLPSTPGAAPLPPVTPHKHVSAAAARARAISPPGQPRKTPIAKRSVAAVEDSEDEDELNALPVLGTNKVVRATRAKIKPPTTRPAGVRGVPASDQRPTRATRSTAAGVLRKPTGAGGTSTATKGSGNGPSPNKIPRLANGPPTRSTTSLATRLRPAPPSPTPSRLPTLVAGRKAHGHSTTALPMAEVAANAVLKKGSAGTSSDAWMTSNPSAVVVPGSKSERPGLRSVRRRRSSFSAADVVA